MEVLALYVRDEFRELSELEHGRGLFRSRVPGRSPRFRTLRRGCW